MRWALALLVGLVTASAAWAEFGFDQKYERDYNIFNPINEFNPKNPLNPINRLNPNTPFQPLGPSLDRRP